MSHRKSKYHGVISTPRGKWYKWATRVPVNGRRKIISRHRHERGAAYAWDCWVAEQAKNYPLNIKWPRRRAETVTERNLAISMGLHE